MKLKCRPDDFRVYEQTAVAPTEGPYALYRLTKHGLGTPEVVEAIVRRWNIPRSQISYGGLKDRHAVTVQYLTIRRGPRRDLKQAHFQLAYLGQASRPFGPGDIQGNRFEIVVRDMTGQQAAAAADALERVQREGLPNYFGEQRFGSLGQSGEFIAQPWCLGDYQRALWLILADPNPHDRPRQRQQRTLLREHWGDWSRLKDQLDRSHWRSIVTYLVDHLDDYRGALARVRQDLRSLYLAAFQSFLWNQMLAELLRDCVPAERLVEIAVAGQRLPCPHELSAHDRQRLHQLHLPLPSARLRGSEGPWRALIDRVLERLGMTLEQLRVKWPRDSFFSKGNRQALFVPSGLVYEVGQDELYPGRTKIALACELPRGSYATILTRRLAVKLPA